MESCYASEALVISENIGVALLAVARLTKIADTESDELMAYAWRSRGDPMRLTDGIARFGRPVKMKPHPSPGGCAPGS